MAQTIIPIPGKFKADEYGTPLALTSDIYDDGKVKSQKEINTELYQALANVYTKQEINNMLADINLFVVTDTLPIASADTSKKIYLVPKGYDPNAIPEQQQVVDDSVEPIENTGLRAAPADMEQTVMGARDEKDEYVTIFENNAYRWEKIGSSSGTSEQVQSDWNQNDSTKKDFIKNKPTIPQPVDAYTKSESDNKYETKTSHQSDWDSLADQIQANGDAIEVLDNTKAAKTDVYTKLQTDAAVNLGVNTEKDRAEAAEEQLRALYEALSESQPIPMSAADWAGFSNYQEGVIYRVAGTTSYTDYMYDGTNVIPMATYDNATDDELDPNSNNLVKNKAVAIKVNEIAGGLAPSKELTWSNGYIDAFGEIKSSSLSKFTQPFLLKAGEIITCGTNNSNIAIICSVENDDTLQVGDFINVINYTSNAGEFEEYSYTATEDCYIVLCVKWSDYSVSFRQVGYASKEVIDNINSNLASTQQNLGAINELSINRIGNTPFKVHVSKGSLVSVEASSSDNTMSYYLRNADDSDSLFIIYGGNGYQEKIADADFDIDHVYVLNSSGNSFTGEIKLRLNHDCKINKIEKELSDLETSTDNLTITVDGVNKDIKNICGGTIPTEFNWTDGFVNYQGTIQTSTLSKFTQPFLLKAGETVTCRTQNTNIAIISRAANASTLHVNDTVTPLIITSAEDQFEEYSYTATEDCYIVLSVLWSNHSESISIKGYASKEIINGLEAELAPISLDYNNVSFKQGTKQVPTSQINVYAELGKLDGGILIIPAMEYLFICIEAYSDSMYTNIVSGKGTNWMSEDISLDIDTSFYYMVKMIANWNIPDNPYSQELHPSDVTAFTYSIVSPLSLRDHIKNIMGEVDAIENKEDSEKIPLYYQTHMDAKCAEIMAKDEQCGYNGDSFIFITDTHVEVNYCHSAQLIKYINQKCGTRLIFNGGDVIDSNCEKNECRKYARDWFSQFEGLRQFVSLGNHDYNTAGAINQDASYCLSSAEMYADYIKRNEDVMVNPGRKNYYYVDNKAQKIRYYVLDLHYFQDTDYKGNDLEINEQLDWVEQTALEAGNEWTIVLFYHIYVVGSNKDGSGVRVSYIRNPLAKRLVDRIDSLVDNPDFPTVAAMLTGHTHIDLYDVSVKGYPIIACDCDASYNYDDNGYDQKWSPKRAAETINEQSFNVVHIDKTNKKILLTRIGYQRSENPIRTEFSYDQNVPNTPDYLPIVDA